MGLTMGRWPAAWPPGWAPPAPFRARMCYPWSDQEADELWLFPSPDVDDMQRKVFHGYGPAGKPLPLYAAVVGVPDWATVRVVRTVNRYGVVVFAVCNQLLQ